MLLSLTSYELLLTDAYNIKMKASVIAKKKKNNHGRKRNFLAWRPPII
jgi:hypothetical protein